MAVIENKEIYNPAQGDPFEIIKKNLLELDEQILATKKRMQALEVAIKGVSNSASGGKAKELLETIATLRKETEKLNKQNETKAKANTILQNARQRQIDLDNERIKQLNLLKKANSDSIQKSEEIKVQLTQQRKINKDLAREKLGLIGIYEKESKQLIKLRKEYKDVAAAEGLTSKKAIELNKEVTKLNDKLVSIDKSAGQFGRVVGNYPKALNKGLLSIDGFKSGLKGLGTQILGAAGIVGAFDVAVQAVKFYANSVKEVVQIENQLNATFLLTSNQAKSTAANIRAIAQTFDQDYNAVTDAAVAVSKELGISVVEATARIEEGFLKGSNNGGEFLDILKEYPAQFRAAGIDAETTFAIINQTAKEGIYSDKGIDAIKEGGLRLRENTKAVREALKPLDDSIKAQIKQEVAAGRSFEAIKLVSEALNDASLTAEETQEIVANVFGGAGEDAGLRYLQTLQDIETSLEDVEIQASESTQSSLLLEKTWNNLVAESTKGGGVISGAWNLVKDAISLVLGAAANAISLFDKAFGLGEKAAIKFQQIANNIVAQNIANAEKNKNVDKQTAEQRAAQQATFRAQAAERKRIQDEEIAQKRKFDEYERNRTQKEIEDADALMAKQDEQVEKDLEVWEQEQELLAEKEELAIEISDVQLAREEEFEKRKTEIQEEQEAKRRALLTETLKATGEALGELLATGEEGFKSFSKAILLTALDATEKFIQLSLARVLANEISTKSFGGIATAAVLSGIVKGVFSRIKSSIAGFADGTEYVEGGGTHTSDSVLANLSKGERVMPWKNNKELLGVSNDDLTDYAKLGMSLNGGGGADFSKLENLMISNNNKSNEMVKALHRLGLSYRRGEWTYIEKADGSGTQKFKTN